ncbi:5949_t:CDS:2, partial [Entrophospora sp. SA101]
SSASPQMSIPSPINDEDDKEKKLDDFLNRVTKEKVSIADAISRLTVRVLPEKVSPEIQVNTSNKVCPPISILPNCVLFSDNDVDAGYYYDLSSRKNICKKSSLEHLHDPN